MLVQSKPEGEARYDFRGHRAIVSPTDGRWRMLMSLLPLRDRRERVVGYALTGYPDDVRRQGTPDEEARELLEAAPANAPGTLGTRTRLIPPPAFPARC